MILTLILLISCITATNIKEIKINYNHTNKMIALYNEENQTIWLHLSFDKK